MKNQAFLILSALVKEHNQAEWGAARFQKRRPELLPVIVSVQDTSQTDVLTLEDGVTKVVIDATVRYRPYYSKRRPGEHKPLPPPKMVVGPIRQGRVKLTLVASEEGRDYTIEFVTLRLKVET